MEKMTAAVVAGRRERWRQARSSCGSDRIPPLSLSFPFSLSLPSTLSRRRSHYATATLIVDHYFDFSVIGLLPIWPELLLFRMPSSELNRSSTHCTGNQRHWPKPF
ncbi:hypothetical protein TIFTF001_054394 [Ficus carica]|uniref:Uncharacterized protein n=1 Tax=Ficus carica TaxID=3494 RepID=A0AA88JIV0_FICCA|nr:hypothetical protein TIFTF001_054394 [Ficus carica]